MWITGHIIIKLISSVSSGSGLNPTKDGIPDKTKYSYLYRGDVLGSVNNNNNNVGIMHNILFNIPFKDFEFAKIILGITLGDKCFENAQYMRTYYSDSSYNIILW